MLHINNIFIVYTYVYSDSWNSPDNAPLIPSPSTSPWTCPATISSSIRLTLPTHILGCAMLRYAFSIYSIYRLYVYVVYGCLCVCFFVCLCFTIRLNRDVVSFSRFIIKSYVNLTDLTEQKRVLCWCRLRSWKERKRERNKISSCQLNFNFGCQVELSKGVRRRGGRYFRPCQTVQLCVCLYSRSDFLP